MAICFQIVRSRRCSIGLQINSQGKLIVRAPKRASIETIKRVVKKHKQWINKKTAEAKERKRQAPKRDFVTGEKFLFLGRDYVLVFKREQKEEVFLDKHLRIRKDLEKDAKKIIKEWYKKQAGKILEEKTCLWADKNNFRIKKVKISWAKKRWGSFSAKTKNINFNWRIIMAPEWVVDYVVLHELVHSKHTNHSKRFWNELEGIYPDYKKAKKWLKEKGHMLRLY